MCIANSSIVFRKSHFEPLADYLHERHDIESGAMAFYSVSQCEGFTKLLVRGFVIPRDEDYLARSAVEVAYTPEFGESCHQICEQNHWHLLDLHNHPREQDVSFSQIDDNQALNKKIPYFKEYLPGTRIAFIVFGANKEIVSARFWNGSADGLIPVDRIIIL